jgi:dTDP-4-dehydrorhamnose 3,5-epimerase-like enzyme
MKQTMNDIHKTSSIEQCRIIELPRLRHPNGSMTVVENESATTARTLPFDVKRVFYIYDAPAGADRGGHSHYCDEQLIVALTGSFNITIDDGHKQRTITLNSPDRPAYIPGGIWLTVSDFSSGAVCMVLVNNKFAEEDYVREYDRFLELTKDKIYNK